MMKIKTFKNRKPRNFAGFHININDISGLQTALTGARFQPYSEGADRLAGRTRGFLTRFRAFIQDDERKSSHAVQTVGAENVQA
jgi:hypothetical protein